MKCFSKEKLQGYNIIFSVPFLCEALTSKISYELTEGFCNCLNCFVYMYYYSKCYYTKRYIYARATKNYYYEKTCKAESFSTKTN